MSTKAFKNEKVEHFKKQFENAKVAVVTDYRGYTVEEITDLRRKLQKSDADYTVTKNTLCKLASKGTSFEAIEELMTGPSAIAFGFGDEVSAAKVVANFIKESKKAKSKVPFWMAKFYQLTKLKNLPSFLQKKNSTQKSSAVSIHLLQVSYLVSTALCQLWYVLLMRFAHKKQTNKSPRVKISFCTQV